MFHEQAQMIRSTSQQEVCTRLAQARLVSTCCEFALIRVAGQLCYHKVVKQGIKPFVHCSAHHSAPVADPAVGRPPAVNKRDKRANMELGLAIRVAATTERS